MWGGPRTCFLVLSFGSIAPQISDLRGVKNHPFPLTRHIAYATACSYRSSCEKPFLIIILLYGPLTDFKMAAAAILNCYFVTVDHPRSLLHGPNIVLKFHVNRITIVGDMAI